MVVERIEGTKTSPDISRAIGAAANTFKAGLTFRLIGSVAEIFISEEIELLKWDNLLKSLIKLL